MRASRRNFVVRGIGAATLCCPWASAWARILPTNLTPLVGTGYRPTEPDERGLWQECERLEKELASSKLLLPDPALKQYIAGVMERLLGTQAAQLRIYPVRSPEFNASMTPNGMMIVQSGLLVRMRNEAQFAAVLGHESGHYLRRHSLQSWRDVKTKTATMAVLGLGGAFGGLLGLGLAEGINASLAFSLFSFSRELESEADAYGLELLNAAGYPPQAAGEVWAQLISERKASARERNTRYKDKSVSMLSTHPPNEDRMRDLTETAAALERASPDVPRNARRAEWLAAVTPLRPMLLEEQVKLNDSGASLYLLESLAQDGWDGQLRYFEGEVYRLRGEAGDEARATQAYAAAVGFENAPAAAYRAHGYALLRAGEREAGRQSLSHYLQLAPQAADAEMVRFSLSQ
jgi:Zn-dependent protease with chaperone function